MLREEDGAGPFNLEYERIDKRNLQCSRVVASRKTSHSGYGYRQQSTKVVVEVPDKKLVPYEEPVDTKQIDSGQPKDSGVQKFVSWEAEPYPIAESFVKTMLMIEKSIRQSASKTNFYAPYTIPYHLTPCTVASIPLHVTGKYFCLLMI